jgi:hypothetical protein
MVPIGIGKATLFELNEARAVLLLNFVNEFVGLKIEKSSTARSASALPNVLATAATEPAMMQALREACQCYVRENIDLKRDLKTQKEATDEERERAIHAEGLLVALVGIFAIYIRFHDIGLLLVGGWSAVASTVYCRRLFQVCGSLTATALGKFASAVKAIRFKALQT